MPDYFVSGAVLRSMLPMPELAATTSRTPDVHFRVDTAGGVPPARWYHRWVDMHGTAVALFGRCGPGRYVVRFPGVAQFVVEREPRSIRVRCVPSGQAPDDLLRRLFLGQVLPTVLARGDRLVLHAAVVATREGAIVIAGRSGAGKSTLSAGWCAAGATLLVDDAASLTVGDRFVRADPGYPEIRLRRDSLEALADAVAETAGTDDGGKTAVVRRGNGGTATPAALPVAALYVLDPKPAGAQTRIVPLTRRDAVASLLPHVYRLDPHDRAELRRELDGLTRLVTLVAVRTLQLPHAYQELPIARDLVNQDLWSASAVARGR